MEEHSLRARSLSLLSDISLHNLVMLSKSLPGRKGNNTPAGLGFDERTGQHMLARSWSPDQVDDVIIYGETIDVIGAPTLRRYIDQPMQRSVVFDTQTREVIHVGKPGFKYLAPESHINPLFAPLAPTGKPVPGGPVSADPTFPISVDTISDGNSIPA